MTPRWALFLLVPLALSCALTVGTLFIFVEKSFLAELGFGRTGAFVGMENYLAALRHPLYFDATVTTLRLAALATVACLLLAYPLAYAIARTSGIVSMLMLGGVLLASLVTTPIKVLGLIVIFSKEGWLNRFLLFSGLSGEPVSVLGTELGVVLGLVYYSLGFAVLLLYSVIRTIPLALEDAAAIHGASRARVFWRVVLPLSMAGALTAALTVFSLSMGAFAAPALMGGGRVLTLPVVIYRTIFIETKYATASTLSVLLLSMVLLINVASIVLVGLLRARSGGPSRMRLSGLVDSCRAARIAIAARAGHWLAPAGRLALRAWIAGAYLLLLAPLFVIACASLNGGAPRSGAIVFPPRRISLDWYLGTPSEHLHALGISVALAVAATALACVFALCAGLGLTRSRVPGREAAAALFRVPLQIPLVIIGLSFFYTYYALDDALGSRLVGSFAGLVAAHFFIVTPFVIGSVTSTLQRFEVVLEEAASSLGATRWRTFRRVTLPVIAPGIFAGATYAFMVSFGDVPVSLFLAGSGNTPFPVVMFHSMEIDFDARILSSSTMVMGIGAVLLLVVHRLVGLDRLTRAEAGLRS